MNALESMQWYAQLEKPFFAPPAWLFGPVWTVLYILIAISFCFVFYKTLSGKWPKAIAIPFALNALANVAFTPIQFALKNNLLALIDILIVLLTIPWMMKWTYGKAHWVAWIQIPYLLWVAFATVLQTSIALLNWN